jgi:ribokinase
LSAEIVVVGSLNEDTTVRVPSLPLPGETVLGQGHFTDTGGKGANQAVAAARLGRRVAMVGKVGSDRAGVRLLQTLAGSGVDTGAVLKSADSPTGMALITVDERGENQIVVSPGANAALRPDELDRAMDLLRGAAVSMLQLEIRTDTVLAAARHAGGTVILNPAPARRLGPELLTETDVLIPNRSELGLLTGAPEPGTVEAAGELAERLAGPAAVVVTLGAEGALIVGGGQRRHVPAPEVAVVDPTGAGDAFCAGVADALVGGADLEEAVRWAVRCGAWATTRWGAQASLPTRADVEALPSR